MDLEPLGQLQGLAKMKASVRTIFGHNSRPRTLAWLIIELQALDAVIHGELDWVRSMFEAINLFPLKFEIAIN